MVVVVAVGPDMRRGLITRNWCRVALKTTRKLQRPLTTGGGNLLEDCDWLPWQG